MRTFSSTKKFFLFNLLLFIGIFFINIVFGFLSLKQYYSIDYLDDLFIHSQWKLPLSKRIMGDGDLYVYAGAKYFEGRSLFDINPEVPPLGKYILGLSYEYWGTPIYSILFCYLVVILVLFLLAREIVTDKNWLMIYLLNLLFLPLLTSQLTQTVLDLPLLMFLVVHIYSIQKLAKIREFGFRKNVIIYLSLAGVSLGCFAAVKFPVLVGPVFFTDLLFFYWTLKNKKITFLVRQILSIFVPLLVVAVVTYIFWFLPFFLQGNNLIDWLKSELWTVHFYLNSMAKPAFMQIFFAMMFGVYKLFATGEWQFIREWSVWWLVGLLVLLGYWFRYLSGFFAKNSDKSVVFSFSKKNKYKKSFRFFANFINWFQIVTHFFVSTSTSVVYLLIVTTSLIVFFSFSSFYSRYLLVIEPLLLLIFIEFLSRQSQHKLKQSLLIFILTVVSFVQWLLLLFPSPLADAKTIGQMWTDNRFEDLYFFVEKPNSSWQEFANDLFVFTENSFVKQQQTEITVNNYVLFSNKVPVTVKHFYITDVGTYTHTIEGFLERRANRWVLIWDDGLILPNWNSDSEISRQLAEQSIVTADKKPLASWEIVSMIGIQNSPKVFGMMDKLTNLVGVRAVDLEDQLLSSQRRFEVFRFHVEMTPKLKKQIEELGLEVVEWRTTKLNSKTKDQKLTWPQILEAVSRVGAANPPAGYWEIKNNDGEKIINLKSGNDSGDQVLIVSD